MHKLRAGDTEARLTQLNILVGPNGGGKTGIIKACAASIREVDWSNWPIDYPDHVKCSIDVDTETPPALILDNSDRYHLLVKLANYYHNLAEDAAKELGICSRLSNECLARMSFGYASLLLDALAIRYASYHNTGAFIDYPEYGLHPHLVETLIDYLGKHKPPFIMMSTQSIDILRELASDPHVLLLVIQRNSIYSTIDGYELEEVIRLGLDPRGMRGE